MCVIDQLVQSRWLDNGHVLSFHFHGARRSRGKWNAKIIWPVSRHPDGTRLNLVNGRFIVRPKRKLFFLGTNVGYPKWARKAHTACSGSQSEHITRFILPAHGLTHITFIPHNESLSSFVLYYVRISPFTWGVRNNGRCHSECREDPQSFGTTIMSYLTKVDKKNYSWPVWLLPPR